MIRRPDTPVMPATAHRLARLGSVLAAVGLLISMNPTDQYGRDHVFSGFYRFAANLISLEKDGIRFGRQSEEKKSEARQ